MVYSYHMTVLTPRDLLALEGFELVVDPHYSQRPDIMGNPECCHVGILLTGYRYAAVDECWMIVYGAAHEIAHMRALERGRGWDHDEDLWSEQADILARWVRKVAGVY